MTPSEELNAAADRLDALLAEVTPGPWEWRDPGLRHVKLELATGGEWKPYAGTVLQLHGEMLSVADAAYIAAMNPDVGRALVALLRFAARNREAAEAAVASVLADGLGDGSLTSADDIDDLTPLALDLARAILATKEGT